MAAGDGTAFFREPVMRLQGFVIRRYATFTTGMVVVANEAVIQHADRPYVFVVGLAMMGLPTVAEDG